MEPNEPDEPTDALTTHRLCDVVFTCPDDWVVEPVPGIRALIAMHPAVERSWRANVMLELVERDPTRDACACLDRLERTLAETQRGFHVRRSGLSRRSSGGDVASIEYDALQDDVVLTQRDVLWPVSPGEHLHVTAASECSLWPRYEPVFDSILASVCSLAEGIGAMLRTGERG